jgi:methionine-rich copper-binding protein CopC
MSRLTAAVTGMLIGLLTVAGLASPAAAHARLLGSTPKDGSTVTEAVSEIRLRFSEPVQADKTTVRVTGPDDASAGTGAARAVDTTVTQAVAALPVGEVTVDWRTVSVDGHTIKGSFSFTNRAAPATATPSTGPDSATPTAAPDSTSAAATAGAGSPVPVSADSDSAGSGWVPVAVAVPAVLAAAAVGMWWWRRRARR